MSKKQILKLKLQYNDHIAKYHWQKALVVLGKMIALEPQAKFYCKQGGIYFKLKEHNKSISSFKKALEIEPENQVAQDCLKKLVLQHDLDISGVRAPKIESLLEVEATVETLLDMPENETVLFNENEDISTNVTQVALLEEGKTAVSMATVVDNPNPHQDQSSFSQQMKENSNQFGRYHLLAKIGSGGMGNVYKVRDLDLDRVLALKVVNMELDTSEGRDRFIREARATAKLCHPNIITVHDIGEQDGRSFFTMDYVEGMSLKQYFQQPDTNLKDILQIFLQICSGLQYAHDEGIIHRDIKPSNIMVVKKKAIIMDFGLAKVTSGDKLSRTGQQMGTPAYMPPEQADGKEIDFRADVYSLGATLYEGLTGRPPFQGENHFNIIYQLHYKDPVSISLLNPDISPELEAVCLKCLEKSPESRYSSADELAKDIENFLKNRPVSAKPATYLSKTWKLVKRNRVISLSVLMVLLSIVVGGLFSFYQWQKTIKSEHSAIQKSINVLLARAKKNILLNEWRESGVLAGEALQLIQPFGDVLQNEKKEAMDIIRASLYGMGLKWEIRVEKENLNEQFFLGKWTKKYTDFLAIHPDGKMMAIVGEKGNICLYDAYDGTFLYSIDNETQEPITALAFHLDGEKIISGDQKGKIDIWDVWKKEHIGTVHQHSDGVSSLICSSDGDLLASSSYDGTIHVYNFKTQKKTILNHDKFVSSIDFGNHDKEIACSSGTKVLVWDLSSQQTIFEYDMIYAPNTSVAYSSSGYYLAVSSWENKIQVFNPKTQEKLSDLWGHTAGVSSLSFKENENILLSSSENGEIIIWDTQAYFPIRHFSADKAAIESSIFHPHKNDIISYSKNNVIRRWSISGKDTLAEFREHKSQIIHLTFSHDGETVASGDKTGDIILWDYQSKKKIGHLYGHTTKILNLAFSPDDTLLASSGYEENIRLWDVKTRKEIGLFVGHSANIISVEFSQNGKNILSSSLDGTVRIWDLATFECLNTIKRDNSFYHATYSNNNLWILTISDQIEIREAANPHNILQTIDIHKSWFSKAIFSPDDSMLAFASGDNVIHVYKQVGIEKEIKYEEIYQFQHDTWVWRLAFSPLGDMLACACADGTVRIIDIHDGIQLYQLSFFYKQNIFALAFHPSGESLVTGSVDEELKIWDFTYESSHVNIPRWFYENMPKKYRNLAMDLNYRRDVSGSVVKAMLETSPRDICQKLFALEVHKDNFSIKDLEVQKDYSYVHTCSDSAVVEYLNKGKHYYEDGFVNMAIDYLQLAMHLGNDETISFIKKNIPEIQEEFIAAYYLQTKEIGDTQDVMERYRNMVLLSPLPELYMELALLYQKVGDTSKYLANLTMAQEMEKQKNKE